MFASLVRVRYFVHSSLYNVRIANYRRILSVKSEKITKITNLCNYFILLIKIRQECEMLQRTKRAKLKIQVISRNKIQ
jgi:hypothetical protein